MGGIGAGAQANPCRVEGARCRASGAIARSPRSPHRRNRCRHAHAKESHAVKILLLNPNTTSAVTDLLYAAGHRAASPGTELVAMTAQRGVPYIATRAEAQIGGAIALEMLAEAGNGFDAAIIAAFGDPGLFGARELFDFPVVGLAEAAMLTACMLGRKLAIVTFARALGPWYQECVTMHGMDTRCAAIRTLDGVFKSISDVQAEKEEMLVTL